MVSSWCVVFGLRSTDIHALESKFSLDVPNIWTGEFVWFSMIIPLSNTALLWTRPELVTFLLASILIRTGMKFSTALLSCMGQSSDGESPTSNWASAHARPFVTVLVVWNWIVTLLWLHLPWKWCSVNPNTWSICGSKLVCMSIMTKHPVLSTLPLILLYVA
jgi:hypothetical protein